MHVIALSCLQPVGFTTMIGGFQPEHADPELREPVVTQPLSTPARASPRPSLAQLRSR
jgi:hypothetical protein